MTILRLLIREVLYRKLHFATAVLAVTLATGSILGTLVILQVHDRQTSQLLADKQAEMEERLAVLNDDMRKAALKLGFNLLILPEDQDLRDWHADDYASKYMPEDYVTMLATSGIVTVRHFLPSLQQKIKWPETGRTIILVGTRGEVPNIHKNPRQPLVQPVPEGTIVLGHELHRSLGLGEGDTVMLMGRAFTVHKCHAERGSKDDITAWISLGEAQELLGRKDQINAILALKCLCAGAEDIARVRKKLATILPGSQAIEIGSRVVARAEARLKLKKETKAIVERERLNREELRATREQLAAIIVLVTVVACGLWIAYLGFTNARDRRSEIGILGSIGYRPGHLLALFLMRSLLVGLAGGIAGFLLGCFGGGLLGFALESSSSAVPPVASLATPTRLVIAIGLSCGLTVIAGWIPALLASHRHPADILSRQ